MTTWPDHYPSECPPDYAAQSSGEVFRFTNRNKPKSNDFFSYYILKPGYSWGKNACNARGLTVYRSVEDCIAAAAAIPALKKKHIAKAVLSNSSGKIAATPSINTKNHKTFWPLISPEDLASLFVPVYQEGTANV